MRYYRTALLSATMAFLAAMPLAAGAQLPALGTRLQAPYTTQKAHEAPKQLTATTAITQPEQPSRPTSPVPAPEKAVLINTTEQRLQALEQQSTDVENWLRRWWRGGLVWGWLWWIPWIVFSWQWWRRRFWVFNWPWPWWWWLPWLWFIPWLLWGWWWVPVWWGWWAWGWWWLPWIFWLPWWFIVLKHVLQWLESRKP